MSRTEWSADDSDGSPEKQFGDALAALAIEDSAEVDAVTAVRESREDV
jgi:hypothetical protein